MQIGMICGGLLISLKKQWKRKSMIIIIVFYIVGIAHCLSFSRIFELLIKELRSNFFYSLELIAQDNVLFTASKHSFRVGR
jgi:hypothetical protein